jgi:hypothetical protein
MADLPMQICASISCIASGGIILLFLKFHDLQKTTFTKLIFYIAICDLFSSIGIALGLSSDGSIKCWIQGILTNIFPICSVFWITVIAYLLTTSIFQRHMVTSLNYQLHIFCWLFPILLTFFPLLTNDIGTQNGDRDWCFLKNRSDSPKWSLLFWTIVSFYFWIWSSIILFCSLFVAILYEAYRIFRVQYSSSSSSPSSSPHSASSSVRITNHSSQHLSTASPSYATIRTSLYRFGWYPLNVVTCWSVTTLFDILKAMHKTDNLSARNLFGIIANCAPGCLGLLNVIAFVTTNAHVRGKVLSVIGISSSDDIETSETNRRRGGGGGGGRDGSEERSFQRRYDANLESEIRHTEVEIPLSERGSEVFVPSLASRSTHDARLHESGSGTGGGGSVWTNPMLSREGKSGDTGWKEEDGSVSGHSLVCLSDGIVPFHQRSSDHTVNTR